MTDQQPHTPEPCDHHWKSYLQPKNVGLSWIRQCSQCGDFDTDNLREQVAAAEQRGKEQGWDEGYLDGYNDGLSDGRNLDNMRDPNENPYRADREGDDETH